MASEPTSLGWGACSSSCNLRPKYHRQRHSGISFLIERVFDLLGDPIPDSHSTWPAASCRDEGKKQESIQSVSRARFEQLAHCRRDTNLVAHSAQALFFQSCIAALSSAIVFGPRSTVGSFVPRLIPWSAGSTTEEVSPYLAATTSAIMKRPIGAQNPGGSVPRRFSAQVRARRHFLDEPQWTGVF